MAPLLAGLLLTLSGLVGVSVVLPVAPAAASYCTTAGGVNLLVDFGALGGGIDTRCGAAGTASAAFSSADFRLDFDSATSMLCRVAEKPAPGKPCIETNAYWALFVSNEGAAWAYASKGVTSQPVDAGDSVALVWQSTNSTRKPSVDPAKPVAAEPAPAKPSTKPTKKPTRKATAKPAAKPSAATTLKPSARPTASATATASPTTSATPSPSATPTESASPTPGTPTPTESSTPAVPESTTSEAPADLDATPVADTDDGGLPGWVAPVAVVALLATAGGFAVARRRKA